MNTRKSPALLLALLALLLPARPTRAEVVFEPDVERRPGMLPTRKGPQTDEGKIRATSVLNKVPIVTTLTGAGAAVKAIAALQQGGWDVASLQSYHTWHGLPAHGSRSAATSASPRAERAIAERHRKQKKIASRL